MISDVVNLGAFQFDIHYDPRVVHAQSASLGSFLGSTGREVGPVGPTIDNDAGTLSFGAFSFGTQPGPDGGGVLARVAFTGAGAGRTLLELRNVQVLDPSSVPQPVTLANGSAEVTGKVFLPFVVSLDHSLGAEVAPQ